MQFANGVGSHGPQVMALHTEARAPHCGGDLKKKHSGPRAKGIRPQRPMGTSYKSQGVSDTRGYRAVAGALSV